MGKKSYFVALFLVVLAGIVGVLVFRLWQVKKTKAIPFSPQQFSLALESPSDFLKGKLLSAEGLSKLR